MPIDAVVADANVLLSAIIGKAALRVFTEFSLQVHTSRFNCDEVESYLPRLSKKYGLPEHLVALQWQILPLRIHPEKDYSHEMGRALRLLQSRDPDDAHPLALSYALRLPLWSNDRDFQSADVRCYPTARLLKLLEDGP